MKTLYNVPYSFITESVLLYSKPWQTSNLLTQDVYGTATSQLPHSLALYKELSITVYSFCLGCYYGSILEHFVVVIFLETPFDL